MEQHVFHLISISVKHRNAMHTTFIDSSLQEKLLNTNKFIFKVGSRKYIEKKKARKGTNAGGQTERWARMKISSNRLVT